MKKTILVLALAFTFTAIAYAQEKTITASEAAKMIDKDVLLEMKVESSSMDKNKSNMFLNSKASFKDADNFTVVVRAGANEKLKEKLKFKDAPKFFKDKTIQVKGKVSTYNDKPQIVVDGSAQLTVIEEKK
jgi:DNA/RNA endonuclease YhcR with UshA esterase domain